MTPPKPSRRRLTQAEWEAELQRANGAAPMWCASCQAWTDHYDHQVHIPRQQAEASTRPLRTRTSRRRSWWQRGWKR